MIVFDRVGIGYDVHPFDPARPLVLGGVVIHDAPGLAGHSDADVVAHAVGDALLGAAGMGDLGSSFPASDETNRDASSVGFLIEIAARLHAAGWRVANVDVVVAAEVPRLAPHVEAIATGVATALAAVADPAVGSVPVNVKPKRGEGLGAIGRAEGIAAWAITLLKRV